MVNIFEDKSVSFSPEELAKLPRSLETYVWKVHSEFLKCALKKVSEIKANPGFIFEFCLEDLQLVALATEIERLQSIVDKNKLEVPDSDDVGTPVNLDNIEPDKFTIPGSLSSSKVPTNETFDVIKQHIKALADLLPIDEKADDEADEMMQEAREKVSLGTRKIEIDNKEYFYDGLVGQLRSMKNEITRSVEDVEPCDESAYNRLYGIFLLISKKS